MATLDLRSQPLAYRRQVISFWLLSSCPEQTALPIVEIREQRSEELEPCTSTLARALVRSIVPLSLLLACFFWPPLFSPRIPDLWLRVAGMSVNIPGQERAQQADTISRKQHRDGLHSESPSMLIGFYQLDTNLHVPTKKECQLRSCPHQTEL